MELQQLKPLVEALVFASDSPLPPERIQETLETNGIQIDQVIDELNREYAESGRAFVIRKVAGGYQVSTRAEFSNWIRKLYLGRQKTRLSQAALETLAIIAFKQPISRVDIAQIRGVNSDGVIGTLLERKMINISGRSEGVGRPLLYSTTPEFLKYFGINDLADLPKPREIEELIGKEGLPEEVLQALSHTDAQLTLPIQMGPDTKEGTAESEAGQVILPHLVAIAGQTPASDAGDPEQTIPGSEISPPADQQVVDDFISDSPEVVEKAQGENNETQSDPSIEVSSGPVDEQLDGKSSAPESQTELADESETAADSDEADDSSLDIENTADEIDGFQGADDESSLDELNDSAHSSSDGGQEDELDLSAEQNDPVTIQPASQLTINSSEALAEETDHQPISEPERDQDAPTEIERLTGKGENVETLNEEEFSAWSQQDSEASSREPETEDDHPQSIEPDPIRGDLQGSALAMHASEELSNESFPELSRSPSLEPDPIQGEEQHPTWTTQAPEGSSSESLPESSQSQGLEPDPNQIEEQHPTWMRQDLVGSSSEDHPEISHIESIDPDPIQDEEQHSAGMTQATVELSSESLPELSQSQGLEPDPIQSEEQHPTWTTQAPVESNSQNHPEISHIQSIDPDPIQNEEQHSAWTTQATVELNSEVLPESSQSQGLEPDPVQSEQPPTWMTQDLVGSSSDDHQEISHIQSVDPDPIQDEEQHSAWTTQTTEGLSTEFVSESSQSQSLVSDPVENEEQLPSWTPQVTEGLRSESYRESSQAQGLESDPSQSEMQHSTWTPQVSDELRSDASPELSHSQSATPITDSIAHDSQAGSELNPNPREETGNYSEPLSPESTSMDSVPDFFVPAPPESGASLTANLSEEVESQPGIVGFLKRAVGWIRSAIRKLVRRNDDDPAFEQ